MTSLYGDGQDQIAQFFEHKRSWSRVKDRIVKDYVSMYLNTVHKLNRNIVLVDAFAGPGKFGDGEDGSPLIICNTIDEIGKRQGRNVATSCVFADTRRAHRDALRLNLAKYIESGICGAPFSDCNEAIAHAIDTYRTSTIFYYLDPFGIRDIEFDLIKRIYERNPKQSTEVLINFNFRAFMRMSGNWRYNASAADVAEKVKSSKVETVNKAMGGDYWVAIVTDPSFNKLDREDAVIQAYLQRLRQFFNFAQAIPVKERNSDEMNVPVDELAHYHLIFATRSSKAVVYMNDVALNALEPYLTQFKERLLFDLTPERYQPPARSVVKDDIVSLVNGRELCRPDIYEAMAPRYFMSYRTRDFRAMVDELVRENRLFPDPSKKLSGGRLNDDVALSATPWSMQQVPLL